MMGLNLKPQYRCLSLIAMLAVSLPISCKKKSGIQILGPVGQPVEERDVRTDPVKPEVPISYQFTLTGEAFFPNAAIPSTLVSQPCRDNTKVGKFTMVSDVIKGGRKMKFPASIPVNDNQLTCEGVIEVTDEKGTHYTAEIHITKLITSSNEVLTNDLNFVIKASPSNGADVKVEVQVIHNNQN